MFASRPRKNRPHGVERRRFARPADGILAVEVAQSRKHRKKVEMLFAHLERILRLDRLRLRGLRKVLTTSS